MYLQVYMLVAMACVSVSWGQAPGDEDDRCTVDHNDPPVYPDTQKNLMDSWSYVNLLPGNGTGRTPIATAVWNDYSYDGNDQVNLFTQTYWQQTSGGICRFISKVCGYTIGTQNNWLFTQYINKSFDTNTYNTYNYDVTIHVTISYSMSSCRSDRTPSCVQGITLLHYMTDSVQLSNLNGNGYMNRDNYQSFAYPSAQANNVPYTNTYTFALPASTTGFYIAVKDNGTCMSISRLRVYRKNCVGQQFGLVHYPEAPAPVSDSVNISVQCIENAVFSLGSLRAATCSNSGTWGTVTPPVCQCKLGYEAIKEDLMPKCIACEAGMYRSKYDSTCQPCPSNAILTELAAPECRCLLGCFRNTESKQETERFEHPKNEKPHFNCTKPPGEPQNLSLEVLSPRETLVTWLPPEELGDRMDLYYSIEVSNPDDVRSYSDPEYLVGSITSYRLTDLRPFTQYCVRVASHNGVSDQDPEKDHLRTIEECAMTPEDVPGPVEEVRGHCSVIVWEAPTEANGVITNYTLLFHLNAGNDSGIYETSSEDTHFEISSQSLPKTPQNASGFVKIRAKNGAGEGNYSKAVYIGCDNPPGIYAKEPLPPPPPKTPEPVKSVLKKDNVIFWSRPNGRVSHYIVSIETNDRNINQQTTTNEQFFILPTELKEKVTVKVCTELDGVTGSCTEWEFEAAVPSTGNETICTNNEQDKEEVSSQGFIIAMCAGCGVTALLVAACCLLVAAIHHWRFRRQFGPNKEALTWEAYDMKTR